MSLLRPMAKPSLERGSVNVTLTSLYVWINHKLQVASKSIFYQIAQTPETFTVILTTTTVMLMVLVGKYVVRNLQRKSPVLLAAFPFPFLNNRRALSICSLPLFSLCISFAFPPIHPTWPSSPKMIFISLPSLSLPRLLSLAAILLFLHSLSPPPHLPYHLIGPLSIDSSSKGKHTSIGECISWQRSHWSNAPFSIASSYNLDSAAHIVWGDPGI